MGMLTVTVMVILNVMAMAVLIAMVPWNSPSYRRNPCQPKGIAGHLLLLHPCLWHWVHERATCLNLV